MLLKYLGGAVPVLGLMGASCSGAICVWINRGDSNLIASLGVVDSVAWLE